MKDAAANILEAPLLKDAAANIAGAVPALRSNEDGRMAKYRDVMTTVHMSCHTSVPLPKPGSIGFKNTEKQNWFFIFMVF